VLHNKDEYPGSGKYSKNLNLLYIIQKYFPGNRSRLSPEFSAKESSIGKWSLTHDSGVIDLSRWVRFGVNDRYLVELFMMIRG
jgi:hypothetical protein